MPHADGLCPARGPSPSLPHCLWCPACHDVSIEAEFGLLRRSLEAPETLSFASVPGEERRVSLATQMECAHVHVWKLLPLGALALAVAIGACRGRTGRANCRLVAVFRVLRPTDSGVTQVRYRHRGASSRPRVGPLAGLVPASSSAASSPTRPIGRAGAPTMTTTSTTVPTTTRRATRAIRARFAPRTFARSSGARASTRPMAARSGSAPT